MQITAEDGVLGTEVVERAKQQGVNVVTLCEKESQGGALTLSNGTSREAAGFVAKQPPITADYDDNNAVERMLAVALAVVKLPMFLIRPRQNKATGRSVVPDVRFGAVSKEESGEINVAMSVGRSVLAMNPLTAKRLYEVLRDDVGFGRDEQVPEYVEPKPTTAADVN